jgi:MSHA pilin protein MshD
MLATLKKSYGYSLIELIITITLTSLVMVMFYTVFSQNQRQSVSPVMQVKAAELAQAYLEEISLKRFDEQSPVGNVNRCDSPSGSPCSNNLISDGEARANYDDVDDYNGSAATGSTDSPPLDALGNIRPGFNNFQVSVLVTYAGNDFSGDVPGISNRDLKKIQITVTTPESDQLVFSHYRGNF